MTINDLRRRLVSKLRAPEDCTDAQLIQHAAHVVIERDTYRDLLTRSRTAVRKPWAAVGIGDMVVERNTADVWTVHGRTPGEGEDTDITFKVTSPSGESREWPMRPADEVTVFECSPIAGAFEALEEALGARWKGVGA
jgi:hypothetical protein